VTAPATPAAAPSLPTSVGAQPGGSEPEVTPREVEPVPQGSGNVPQGEATPSDAAAESRRPPLHPVPRRSPPRLGRHVTVHVFVN
jgi:hypothetical protein